MRIKWQHLSFPHRIMEDRSTLFSLLKTLLFTLMHKRDFSWGRKEPSSSATLFPIATKPVALYLRNSGVVAKLARVHLWEDQLWQTNTGMSAGLQSVQFPHNVQLHVRSKFSRENSVHIGWHFSPRGLAGALYERSTHPRTSPSMLWNIQGRGEFKSFL